MAATDSNSGDQDETLVDVGKRASGCVKCELSENRQSVVFGVGPMDAPAMFVGEAPGQNEDEQGEPFVGRAGQFMDKCLKDLDIHRECIYITNVVKCRPPENRDPKTEEMNACETYLQDQIRHVSPDVIVTMGSVASKRLTRSSKGISQLRGNWFSFEDRTPVLPTYHPAYLLRQRSAIKKFRRDVRKIFQEIDRKALMATSEGTTT